jgi:hypothetical protein
VKLAVLLLALILGTHYGPDWIGATYVQQEAATKAWFYMARGVAGVVLFALVAIAWRHRAVTALCLIGMYEEGLTTACRASKPIGGVLGFKPFSGLCGDGWYLAGLVMLALAALGILYELGRLHGKK